MQTYKCIQIINDSDDERLQFYLPNDRVITIDISAIDESICYLIIDDEPYLVTHAEICQIFLDNGIIADKIPARFVSGLKNLGEITYGKPIDNTKSLDSELDDIIRALGDNCGVKPIETPTVDITPKEDNNVSVEVTEETPKPNEETYSYTWGLLKYMGIVS